MTFTQVQNGSVVTASTSGGVTTLTLTLPVASTAGTLLVACIVTGQAGRPMKISGVTNSAGGVAPNSSPGWEWCATSDNGAGGGGQQVEIWCYRKNPGSIASTTWTIPTSDGARGHLMEFSTTLAYQVLELFPGLNTAVNPGDTSFPVSMGNPVGSGELAIVMFGDNFNVSTALTWTTPTGWTLGRSTTSGGTIMMHWASYYQTTAAAGAVSVTGVASTATNQVGWEAALVVFREASSVRSRVGGSCSSGSYNDQASFGLPATKAGSAAEADIFVGRTMFQSAQVSYQKEGAHLTGTPVHGGTGGDLADLYAMGAQIVWAMKPRRTGLSGFTTVADEQAAVDQDLTYVKQSGINGFICTMYNEFQLGGSSGAGGPFGNDTFGPGPDPYGSGNTAATAKKHWLTYWANYQPIYAAHGIQIYTKPALAVAPDAASSWQPPAGTLSGVVCDMYSNDGINSHQYLDQSPASGVPSLQDICDGVRNPDNTTASNTPIPLGIGETGRAGSGSNAIPWSQVVTWSHTGASTGHLRDFFAARLAAGKQNAPILWFENNLGSGNWIHTPGANGEDQTGIQAELAAWVDNLAPQAAGTTVTVTTTSLPDAPLGVAYSQALHVTGGAAPYTWTLNSGALPTGLSLSSAGVISGTPTVAGSGTAFTVKATDAGANFGISGSLTITVPGMSITTTSINPASIGVPYSQTLTETGGTGPFTWAVTSDSVLPAGITLSSAGVLSGTTGDVPGPYAFTVVLTDSLASTARASFTLTVSAGSTGGGTPVTLPPGFPRVFIEAGFYSPSPVAQPGTFILDDPANGQLDTGTLSDGIAWTDITAYVRSGTINRASTRVQGPLRTYQAGTASVVLKNADGRFDSLNPAGAYVVGSTTNIRAMLPVRIRAVYGSVEYHLFSGFIDTWTIPDANLGPRYSEASASATDAFKVFAGITLPPVPEIGTNQPSGSRINQILTDASWYTDHRDLDDGNSGLHSTTYGDTVMNLLQLAADSEAGELYINGAGAVVFRERQAVLEDARSVVSQALFSDPPGYSPLTPDSQGFEATAGTWTQAGNCSIARSTAAFHSGAASLAVTSTGAGNMTAAHCQAANITTQGLPVSPGQSLGCSAWLLAAASARSAQAGAQFYDLTGTAVPNGLLYGPAIADSTSVWTQVAANITVPPGAAYARLSVQVLAAGGASETHYLDDAVLGGTGLAYTGVARATDDTTLANDVQVTNAVAGAVLQEAQDAGSIAKYLFPRTYSRTDIILQSDAEALAYAQWVLYLSLNGEDRFDTLTVTPLRDPAGLWPQVLGRDIGDRITIIRDPPGMGPVTKDVFIRGITHTVDYSANTWQTVWDLDDAARYAGFLILDDPTEGRVGKGNLLAF